MIKAAKLLIGYKNALLLLKTSGVLFAENTSRPFSFSPEKFSEDFFKISLSENYSEIYTAARVKRDYDILLTDSSILQFSYEENKNEIYKVRYAFYEPHIKIPNYEKFRLEKDLPDTWDSKDYYLYFDQFIDEANDDVYVTPVRYDMDLIEFETNRYHPVSHLHIGHENDIRIPMERILTPDAFVAFILRHFYRKIWLKSIENEKFLRHYFSIHKTCPKLNDVSFPVFEKDNLYFA